MATQDSNTNWIEIPLTQGKFAIVDNEDSDLINLKWYASKCKTYADKNAYRAVRNVAVNGKRFTVSMHCVILERMLGRKLEQKEWVDHIDGNPLNNRRENLRLASPSQNSMNRTMSSRNTSGYRGVCWNEKKKRWIAQIKFNQKQIHLGNFHDAESAYEAYSKAAQLYFGEFRREKDERK